MNRCNVLSIVIVAAALSSELVPVRAQYSPPPQLAPGVDYTLPNYAYSPPLTKFVDSLPGLAAPASSTAVKNNLGQYIPSAVADTTTYAGTAYYEIAVVDYLERMHSDLPPTRLRGYVQVEPPGSATTPAGSLHVALTYPNGTPVTYGGIQVYGYDKPHYLGPTIVAARGIPTRVKFYNLLPPGAAGDLFIPTDTTIMGAGLGPDGMTMYSENRATLHLHGGDNPWISDGTAHQWITPASEPNIYRTGVSQRNVPDMPTPTAGSATFYWPNGLSGRLMFYHDHAYGMTRLDVYSGEAAGYVLVDPTERALNSFAPGGELPLIIQDRSFVNTGILPARFPAFGVAPATTATLDPLWASNPNWVQTQGGLWLPHVYIPNQNPNDISGANPVGRWDYGPWFWPVFPSGIPPQVSAVPEAFMDTPLVNGTAYPTLTVNPTAYRFRVLNACNDRYINLQLYVATSIVSTITVDTPGSGYSDPVITITDASNPAARGATAWADVDPTTGAILSINLWTVGSGYVNPVVQITDATGTGASATATAYRALTEVGMVPASKSAGIAFPTWWRANDTLGMTPNILDGREGGVPDPSTIGPSFVHIGSEGGISPKATVLKNTPIGYEQNKRSVTVLNTFEHTLFLGPAERADVMVDFSAFAGKTIILYNDAPAPLPAGDPRYDFYTAAPDNTPNGGAPSTVAGFGPNTRTIMQITVAPGTGTPLNVVNLSNAVVSAFASTQPPAIVPAGTYARISDTSMSVNGVPIQMQSKAIQELFDPFGRMNATLGVEVPFTTATIQTTLPYGFIDPATEVFPDGTTQLWKITHNGVDTHAIHFHLFNVQVINRVGWDGAIKPPWSEELGWKDTVKMNPLEDIIVALQPKVPTVPFAVPNNVRPLDPSMALGSTMGFLGVDPNNSPVAVSNIMANFGAEYTWHCHLLGHEENDMMRPIMVAVAPAAPTALVATLTGNGANRRAVLNWSNPGNATGVVLQKASNAAFTQNMVMIPLGLVTTYTDTIGNTTQPIYYRVYAINTVGSMVAGYPTATATGLFSATAGVNISLAPTAPSGLAAALVSANQVQLTWTDNANNETGFEIWRAANGGTSALLTTVAANIVTYTDGTVTPGTTYTYQVRAINAAGPSAYSNPATITVTALTPPTAPGSLTATAARGNGANDTVTLNWVDNSNNETSFTVQRATNARFTTGLNTTTGIAANTVTLRQTGLARNRTFYYRIQAVNAAGPSAWVNAAPFPVTTP